MSNVQTMPEVEEVKSSLSQGATALQTRSSFQTAVKVIKERNLERVLQKCKEEAAIAGDDFYYSWSQGGEPIEGLTVGAAQAIVRNFGNCALEVQVEETPTAYIFNGIFIDLETGFNLVRPFRQNKQSPKTKTGKDIYSGDRGQDIIFQIGTSKAMRNAALNAMPKWLTNKVMEMAKENVVEKINKMGREKAVSMILKKSSALGIGHDRIESVYGKERVWDIETIIKITSAIRAVEDGMEKAEELFPKLEPEQKEPEVTTATVVKEEKKDVSQKEEFAAGRKPLSRVELLGLIRGISTTLDLQKFKGQYIGDIESLSSLDHEEVVQAITTREMELNREKKVPEPKSESSVLIDFKNKIAGTKLATTLNNLKKTVENNSGLDADQKVYLHGLIDEKLKTAK